MNKLIFHKLFLTNKRSHLCDRGTASAPKEMSFGTVAADHHLSLYRRSETVVIVIVIVIRINCVHKFTLAHLHADTILFDPFRKRFLKLS